MGGESAPDRSRGGRPPRRRAPGSPVVALLTALFLSLLPSLVPAEGAEGGRSIDPGRDLAPAGWREEAPGLFGSLPERSYQALDRGLAGEFALAPGESVVVERRGEWKTGTGSELSLELRSEGTNRSSDDYARRRACFPVSVTAVFGRDSRRLPFGKRIRRFFGNLLRGLPPGGIRLTYAFGSTVPVGSMYRLEEEETVFILAGVEESGRKVASKRAPGDDFRAAYGRDPSGPVTRLVVRACRPAEEQGPLKSGFRLTFDTP